MSIVYNLFPLLLSSVNRLAQSVEHQTFNLKVMDSSPILDEYIDLRQAKSVAPRPGCPKPD